MDELDWHGHGRDRHLWGLALLGSLGLNGLICLGIGAVSIESERWRHRPEKLPPESSSTVLIFPESVPGMAKAPPTAAAAPSVTLPGTPQASLTPAPPLLPPLARTPFARTSPDQSADAPIEPAPWIGERNTRATSDRAPDPNAPALPSQAGMNPREPGHVETTESKYRDGKLDGSSDPAGPDAPPAEPAAMAQPDIPPLSPAPAKTEVPGPPSSETAVAKAAAPTKPTLAEGPLPVDMPVKESSSDKLPKPSPLRSADLPTQRPGDSSAAIKDPAFRGNQRKTAIVGSISRKGRSALNVTNSPLGRYEALLSRAVELEWQRNCMRHRDFITPGYLTVQFFVDTRGKVRSVQFVGDMSTGEVQKGFTLNAIRDAEIPPMPPALRKEYADEPLELIFRFYF